MEVRQSTKEKIKQAVTIVCENQKQNGVKWMTINQKLREIKGNILIPQIMRSALKNKNNSPKNRKRQINQQKQPALQE